VFKLYANVLRCPLWERLLVVHILLLCTFNRKM